MNHSAAADNAIGISLRAQGRLTEAIAAFERAHTEHPDVAELSLNLAQTRYESGDNTGAAAAFRAALATDPENVAAHFALYELLQIAGDSVAAIEHQRRALEVQRIFTSIAPRQQRTVLVLNAPGDWQTNIPIDFLLDRSTTTVHKLYLLDRDRLETDRVPPYDLVWNAIAESIAAQPYLALAQAFVCNQSRPSLNPADRVLATGRLRLGETLRGLDCLVAPIEQIAGDSLNRQPFDYPVIVRPVGSHAGHGLEKLGDACAVQSYAQRVPADSYFVSPFIDYCSEDRFYRKYRIVFVDGEPYPVHLAISPRWMIHYYNAAMAENQWMRDEEARFLEHPRDALSSLHWEALTAIASAVGLEYFGIDCALGRDGRILVFEADPAMLVHSSDSIELYPYKQRFIPRIYRAVERMIDRRKAADT